MDRMDHTDRTLPLLILNSRELKGFNIGSKERLLLRWVVTGAPYWVLRGVCRVLGDYGPPTVGRVDGYATVQYRIHGELHRFHGPALETRCGTRNINFKEWVVRGEVHRDGDLPAIIREDGTQEWWKRDELHRDGDLPAVICYNGDQEWWKDGERQRDGDLPAVVYSDGTQVWSKPGKGVHRDGDLPAIIRANGDKEWWKNGEEIYQ